MSAGTSIDLRENRRALRRKRGQFRALLCIAGVIINLVGVRLAKALGLPIYLDSVGTVLSASLGGYIPGIAAGIFTNLINGLFDYSTSFYSSINVLIAIAASFFASKGFFKNIRGILISIITLTLIGGGLGSVLTWFLNGGALGHELSSALAHSFYENRGFTMFGSQLTADLLIDLADKSVTVAFAVLIYFMLPGKIKKELESLQEGQDKAEELYNGDAEVKRISLRVKVLLLISGAAVIITAGVTAISLSLFHDAVMEEAANLGSGAAAVASYAFDPDRVSEYMELGEKAYGYAASERRLSEIRDSSSSIEYVYVYKIRDDGCHVVFDPDTAEEPGGEPGEVIPFDQAFLPYIPDLLIGREIEPIVSNESFGWLLSIYKPVYNSDGKCACYVGVDISMRGLARNERIFLTRVISLFAGFFILLLAIGAYLAEISIITPINTMSAATSVFANSLDDEGKTSLDPIYSIDVETGDEIENLYNAVKRSSEKTVQYINTVKQKNRQISKLQNGLVLVLADIVESRDKCTGNHVKNTAFYVWIILEKMRELGMHKEMLTEKYIDEVVDSAPLHDIGKIQVPDAVLNKPGKLSEEEYELMKSHTIAGAEIIDQAIKTVSDKEYKGYLNEARNLTLYHHERWDGKGYPYGLKGEEIPLSARVMAVADVFDALVARRSYKEGFPFDKAVNIIKEDAGTHFDPDVVEAFMQCLDAARDISEEANEDSLKDY